MGGGPLLASLGILLLLRTGLDTDFVTDLYKHVPVLDSGARGSTTTFAQRGIGDVLLAWENEAFLALNELGADKFDIVVPPFSILAEPPVSLVDVVADKRGTRKVAQAYLDFLYSPAAQKIIAANFYRPSRPEAADQGPVVPFAALAGTDVATFMRERPGMSAFAREDGVLYHTYSTYARGLDALWGMYQWLDRAPKGRNETGVWWRRHDEYESLPQNAGSCCHAAGTHT